MSLVLIVDDNQYDRRHFRHLLEKLGHDVVEAESGEQGLEAARSQPVDLILLDRIMPGGMDGKEVLQHLKSDGALCEIPVLVVTGAPSDDRNLGPIAEFIELGADDYLSKSPDVALLRARVANCIQRKRAQDQQKRFFKDLQREQQLVARLQNALLPKHISAAILAQLRERGKEHDIDVPPQRHPAAAVMFCDIVNFTEFCEHRDPQEVIRLLNRLIGRFDGLCDEFHVEKIKTIGDSFMATANVTSDIDNPVRACIDCGLAMKTVARDLTPDWRLRIGIDFGSIVAGVVGRHKFQFDVWGRTVNLASRIESEGEDGEINLSQAAWTLVADMADGKRIHRELKGLGLQPIYVFSRYRDR